ncbi:MAG: hypothetical protein HC888_19560 [Candidatus Competibacteraceae bacterium]|nr:hypothetical protein [Candidatus Competibacteraceae bacterium]
MATSSSAHLCLCQYRLRFPQVFPLKASITNYLDGELAGYGKVHALLQSVNLDGSHNPNHIGDSESGYGSLTQQAAQNVP